jgi:hypothetical protein
MRAKAIALVVFLALSLVLVPTASASVIGTLVLSSGAQGVMVSSNTIDWTPLGPPNGTFETAFGTNLTYGAGTPLGAGATGSVLDLTAPTAFPVNDFFTFASAPGLDFMLGSLGPATSNTNCAALVVGGSCSITSGSPFLLTLTAGSGTSITLTAGGTVTDGMAGPASKWLGSFTTQITTSTPAQIQANFLNTPNYSISSSYSGEFVASAIPESSTSTMALAGLGLILLSRIRNWRKRPV